MNRILTAIAAALLLAPTGRAASLRRNPERRSERVHFAKGATSTVIKGQVKGYHYVRLSGARRRRADPERRD